ncbi:helix-turn-helix domain-containing protein [Shewanella aestuarii]|uniref:Helix-turn-helix domain-containing protein n=1 Tax=Shewanella aestuarii TaxID=1028752 RepID=A0A6G9QJ74_9GAMM|nr:helix-turn-helix domain-containing protein [Shewanella aestuarii]QIR13929.1 helix-turn-helix domain-containing protein [Shewanella aestuarii]
MAESKTEKGSWLPESIEQAVIQSGLDLYHAWIVSKAISYYKANRDYHASNAYLAKKLGKSTRQIQRYIKDLERFGWLYVNQSKSVKGSSRKLLPTQNTLAILRGDIDVMPRGDIDVMGGVTPVSPNNKDHNKVINNTVLTTTSFENDADVFYKNHLRKLIAQDLGIETDDMVFEFYEVARQWAELVTNVDIPEQPNTSIIQLLLSNDTLAGFANSNQVIEFLDGRYQERNVFKRDKPVNLSWLMCAEMEDLARDGILSSEGFAEQWSNNAVKLLAETLV